MEKQNQVNKNAILKINKIIKDKKYSENGYKGRIIGIFFPDRIPLEPNFYDQGCISVYGKKQVNRIIIVNEKGEILESEESSPTYIQDKDFSKYLKSNKISNTQEQKNHYINDCILVPLDIFLKKHHKDLLKIKNLDQLAETFQKIYN